MGNQKGFLASFTPIGHFKGQKEPLWNLTLEFGYENPERVPHINVLDFGFSYGTLKIDDIEFVCFCLWQAIAGKHLIDQAIKYRQPLTKNAMCDIQNNVLAV